MAEIFGREDQFVAGDGLPAFLLSQYADVKDQPVDALQGGELGARGAYRRRIGEIKADLLQPGIRWRLRIAAIAWPLTAWLRAATTASAPVLASYPVMK